MTFIQPGFLLLLFAILPAGVFLLWRERLRRQMRQRLVEATLADELYPQTTSPRLWKSALWLLALASLIVALARPVWGVDLEIIETQGVNVVFVLDVSNSMAAQDFTPSRLGRAKLAIRDLFTALEGNEVALVLFAGTAFIQLPPTTDTTSALNFVNVVDTSSITQQGTNLESALQTALDSFNQTSPAARIIVLLTDGESHEGDITRVVNEAAAAGVIIHAIGYGDADEGAPVPVFDEAGALTAYKLDEAGNVVLSRLDETTLQSITTQTGGTYYRAAAAGSEITSLINRIRETEASVLENRRRERGVERFGIFVALALLALSLEIALPEIRTEAA